MLEDHLLFLENELSSKNVNEHIVSSSPLLQPLMDFKYTQRIGKSRGPENHRRTSNSTRKIQ